MQGIDEGKLGIWLQVDVAAVRVRGSVLQTAEAEGLTYQAYWFSTTLALGAFLKVGTVQRSNVFCFLNVNLKAELNRHHHAVAKMIGCWVRLIGFVYPAIVWILLQKTPAKLPLLWPSEPSSW